MGRRAVGPRPHLRHPVLRPRQRRSGSPYAPCWTAARSPRRGRPSIRRPRRPWSRRRAVQPAPSAPPTSVSLAPVLRGSGGRTCFGGATPHDGDDPEQLRKWRTSWPSRTTRNYGTSLENGCSSGSRRAGRRRRGGRNVGRAVQDRRGRAMHSSSTHQDGRCAPAWITAWNDAGQTAAVQVFHAPAGDSHSLGLAALHSRLHSRRRYRGLLEPFPAPFRARS